MRTYRLIVHIASVYAQSGSDRHSFGKFRNEVFTKQKLKEREYNSIPARLDRTDDSSWAAYARGEIRRPLPGFLLRCTTPLV